MDLQEYLARMNSGEPVQGGGDMHRFMREINEVTMRLTCELNNKYHTGEEVREIFSKIIGKPVDKSFRLFPPFYTNCGKNTTVGKGVFINTGCHFQDQGGITLGDGTFLGNNVVLTTMNHDFNPEHRSTTYPAPIVTGRNVWIGSSVTIVPASPSGTEPSWGPGRSSRKTCPPIPSSPASPPASSASSTPKPTTCPPPTKRPTRTNNPTQHKAPCQAAGGRFFCAVIMAGCTVFSALFDIYKFHHRHDDEKKK